MESISRCSKRLCAVLLSLALCFVLALSTHAASASPIGITFWKENSNKESMENAAVDTDREATLTRLANGTYMLVLPIRQISKLGVTGHLIGLTIGDIAYDGTVSGDFSDGSAVLTIKNLPASILTGGDCNNALRVTCNIQMDAELLGAITTCARMSIWAE